MEGRVGAEGSRDGGERVGCEERAEGRRAEDGAEDHGRCCYCCGSEVWVWALYSIILWYSLKHGVV